jgi:hypothetical protein
MKKVVKKLKNKFKTYCQLIKFTLNEIFYNNFKSFSIRFDCKIPQSLRKKISKALKYNNKKMLFKALGSL